MAITTRAFGTTQDGQNVTMYTLTNHSGASVSMLDLGAIVTNILVPDKSGKLADVALGFDTLAHYEGGHGAMGDTIGRFANRIGGGCFTLDGTEYHLYQNDGENTLHGGKAGFQKKVWQATPVAGDTVDSVKFHYVSADMEENFPGNLTVDVTILWDDDCNLTFRYQATTDKATVVNMTNHTYFNLAGYDHGTVRDHAIYIDSDVVTAVDSGLIPTGGYVPVSQTPLDLREEMLIGDGLDRMSESVSMGYAKGYDHNYVLRKGSAMGLCACVHHEESGRTMEVITDQPGVQFYTACTTDYADGKGGMHYLPYSGLCLETQHYPDSPNHPNFPTTTLRPGEIYDTTTIYAFRVDA